MTFFRPGDLGGSGGVRWRPLQCRPSWSDLPRPGAGPSSGLIALFPKAGASLSPVVGDIALEERGMPAPSFD